MFPDAVRSVWAALLQQLKLDTRAKLLCNFEEVRSYDHTYYSPEYGHKHNDLHNILRVIFKDFLRR